MSRKRGRITVQSQPTGAARGMQRLMGVVHAIFGTVFAIVAVTQIMPNAGLIGLPFLAAGAFFAINGIRLVISKNGMAHRVAYDVEQDMAESIVGIMEDAPEEAVKNNVFGTYNCALCAEKYGVEKFVMISTDKAVNPTSVMGATKRICEMIVQNIGQNSEGSTTFVAVRFGNVLGSNGSVLPLFKEQLAEGGPLTVTHPDIVRYFMTIPEAVSLVLEAGAMGDKSGEIYVLDMGNPVKILTLAENLIKMSGFIPYKDIDIVFTGLRPGEKLYEELMQDEESVRKTMHSKIFIGSPLKMDTERFFTDLLELKALAYENDRNRLLLKIKDMVPTFNHEIANYE